MGNIVAQKRKVWGVQVGTWERNKKAIADKADKWLREKGFDSKLYTVDKGNKYIIIVGSFYDREDPELKTTLDDLHGIDDYPDGDSAPFRTARIQSFEIVES
jgi:cell division protein FtsN